MPRCKEAASPRNTRSIFSFSAGTFPLGSLQDLNAADNRQRLFLALCRMDDPDDRKNAEHQGKDPEEAGYDQNQQRTDLQKDSGQHIGQHAANHYYDAQDKPLVCMIPSKGIFLCGKDGNQDQESKVRKDRHSFFHLILTEPSSLCGLLIAILLRGRLLIAPLLRCKRLIGRRLRRRLLVGGLLGRRLLVDRLLRGRLLIGHRLRCRLLVGHLLRGRLLVGCLLRGGLLIRRLLGRGLLIRCLLGRRLLASCLPGRGLLVSGLLGSGLLVGRLLGSGLLVGRLLGSGLLIGALLGFRLRSRGLLWNNR